jgi:hypothetical protein
MAAALFLSQGFTPLSLMSERVFGIVMLVFATASVLACLFALIAMIRGLAPEHPAIIRLPQSRSAGWALGFTAAFYPAVVLFTGNTLFDLMRALGLPDETFGIVFRTLERLGLWSIALSAAGAFVMAVVTLTRKKGRALVLGLALLPAPIVLAFMAGELLGHG